MAQPQQRATSDCKILSVVWYKVLPPRFGGQKAVAGFNRYIADLAPLICICSKNNLPNNELYEVKNCLPINKWQFVNPFVWRKIYRIAKKEKITHLVLEFPYLGIAASICKKFLGLCFITNTHNVEYLRFKEQKKWWWRMLFYFEKWVLNQSDLVFFKTRKDLDHAVSVFSLNQPACEVIPYGAEHYQQMDFSEAKDIVRKRHRISENESIFLFAGTLDYQPNADAVIAIHEMLVPSLNKLGAAFKLLICGRNNLPGYEYINKIKNQHIILAGEVPDIETYFQAADVFLDPVLSGGGIQTKIIDALSYHLNVVAFQSKCEIIEGAQGKLTSVPDGDWQAFAAALTQMTHRKKDTPAAFFEAYHWPTITSHAFQKMTAC